MTGSVGKRTQVKAVQVPGSHPLFAGNPSCSIIAGIDSGDIGKAVVRRTVVLKSRAPAFQGNGPTTRDVTHFDDRLRSHVYENVVGFGKVGLQGSVSRPVLVRANGS